MYLGTNPVRSTFLAVAIFGLLGYFEANGHSLVVYNTYIHVSCALKLLFILPWRVLQV